MGFEIRGSIDVGKITAAGRAGALNGLGKAAEFLRTEAVQEAPVLTGTLRGSAAVEIDAGALVAAVSFNTPYAVRQHEELGYSHPKGGKAKYLEDPFNHEQSTMQTMIANSIREALA